MTDERPGDEGMAGIISELEAAGLLTVGTDAEGRETWTVTATGAQVATQMAMSSEDDALAMLNGLLDAAQADAPDRQPGAVPGLQLPTHGR